MTVATFILWAMALALLAYAWYRRDGSFRRGLRLSWTSLRRTTLILVLAFIIVGYVNTLAPQELVRSWMGPQSGLAGLLVGEAGGMLLPGGPYVIFPVISALYAAGAGLGPIVAMITSWAMLAFLSVSFELPFLGWRFSAIRLSLSLPFPALVGLLAHVFFTS
jgi:uncharacterized membrane protein YraQ (UPF0718 family)